jgi:signal transduction histidine kinase
MKLQTQMFNRAVTKNSPSAFDPTKVKQVMGIMDKGLNRLVRLVDDMLDISRIQVGKLALLREEEDITSVVAETMQRLLPELSNAGIELRMNLAPHILCDLDRFRFEQVLTNLTTNAIRYAPNAPLDVKLEKIDDRILLRFQDHGPGIPETDREKIFVRFERLVSANQISGMGLGLFICREIIEGHGGTIRVDGENSSGACFIITLPQRSASQ